MIGVVIPVHDEEQLLGACIDSVLQAAAHPDLGGEAVQVLAVLDACSDSSAAIAEAAGIATLAIDARNVGQARATGVRWLLDRGARWIACTDADSIAGANWLAAQLALGADVVCGTVRIAQWDGIHLDAQARYHAHYQQHDDHRHVHGANLGFSAEAYLRAGGFRPWPPTRTCTWCAPSNAAARASPGAAAPPCTPAPASTPAPRKASRSSCAGCCSSAMAQGSTPMPP